MSNDDVVRLIGIAMALVLVVANLRGQRIGLSDGFRMAALWGFLIVTVTLVFSVLGW
ncbi:hypothetical protein [Novosphingobium taihuense]|uniref:Uncharacterized protein n=1 Tax=Novosphingobium taihuense TaxID=260085 RepID=A0A7W7ABJ5_9SPHN|nr:hypothetical protein [Novosphingobium taihuense]MBB4613836.1 hypothetical protein [Novosphingobium taihuense]TWH83344.1 hypothetical protein IQ25_02999 [Novosphingobium taihuense]